MLGKIPSRLSKNTRPKSILNISHCFVIGGGLPQPSCYTVRAPPLSLLATAATPAAAAAAATAADDDDAAAAAAAAASTGKNLMSQ